MHLCLFTILVENLVRLKFTLQRVQQHYQSLSRDFNSVKSYPVELAKSQVKIHLIESSFWLNSTSKELSSHLVTSREFIQINSRLVEISSHPAESSAGLKSPDLCVSNITSQHIYRVYLGEKYPVRSSIQLKLPYMQLG